MYKSPIARLTDILEEALRHGISPKEPCELLALVNQAALGEDELNSAGLYTDEDGFVTNWIYSDDIKPPKKTCSCGARALGYKDDHKQAHYDWCALNDK